MLRSAPCALLTLAVACAPPPDSTSSDPFTVRDSAGVAIVENHRPMLGDTGWQITPEPLLSLPDSVATGGLPYVLAGLRLPSGEILVASGSAVQWIDRHGALIRRLGGEGVGPGEFRNIEQVLLRADSIVVVGFSNTWKSAIYDPGGTFVRDELLDYERFRALGRWTECQSLTLPDGGRLSCQFDPTIPGSETNRASRVFDDGRSSPGPGLLRQLRRIHLAPAGFDTSYPLGIDIGIEQFGVDLGGGRETFVTHPFHARTLIAMGGDPLRVAILSNPAWQVELWSPKGQLDRLIRHDQGRRAPSPTEVERARDLMLEWELRYARDSASKTEAVSQVPTPDSLPGAMMMVMDRGGALAVTRGGVWAEGFPTTIDFFDASGRWLVTKQMPARWRLLDFGGDYLLGVRYDADDLPHLELYGLAR